VDTLAGNGRQLWNSFYIYQGQSACFMRLCPLLLFTDLLLSFFACSHFLLHEFAHLFRGCILHLIGDMAVHVLRE